MKCPCEDCLIIPICRFKEYSRMMKCSIVFEYLYYRRPLSPTNRNSKFKSRIFIIRDIVKPDSWMAKMKHGRVEMSSQ
jgi:hypothetical protein